MTQRKSAPHGSTRQPENWSRLSVESARKVAGNRTERRWIRFFGIATSQVEITRVGNRSNRSEPESAVLENRGPLPVAGAAEIRIYATVGISGNIHTWNNTEYEERGPGAYTHWYLINTSSLPEEQFPPGTQHPPRRNDQSFWEWVSRRTNLSLGVSHETPQYLDFDFMCVLRTRGMGPAASGQVLQQLGPVPQAQHAALEPV